jgi:segregation and condensation protein A
MTDEAGNASYRVALPEFEGPLDLLLHLCKTNEIDVVNLPVAFITQKYLEYLDVMKSLSVDVAADYLVMAATLAYLKARELVPTPDPLPVEDEEGEEVLDPREELIRRLLEYRKYKDAAEQLGGRPIEGKNVFGRGMPIETEGPASPLPFAEHSVWKLIEAFGKLLEKAGPKLSHEVMFDRVSISARINQVIDRLEVGSGSFRFDALFDVNLPEHELRSQLVVTLLAILELARLKVVRVVASEDQETLFIAQVQGAALSEARRVHVTSDAEGLQSAEELEAAESSEEPPPEEIRAETEEPPSEEVRAESVETPPEEVRAQAEEPPPEDVHAETEEPPPNEVRMESHKEPHEEA